MKNICFITQCSLPIPPTKGGAVETLVEYILDENEKTPHYHFTVISVGDKEAEQKSKKYKHADFLYVEEKNQKLSKILAKLDRVLKHFKIYVPFSMEFREALKRIKQLKEQDIYIYEAGPTTQLVLLNKIIPKEKLVAHIHWDGMGNERLDKCFSSLLPVSNYIGNQWLNATKCNSNKIKPLYNCANIERFTKQSTEEEKIVLRKELGIGDDSKVVIFTGRIVEEKGLKELLQAFKLVKHDNVTLLIIGSANFGAKTNTQYEQEVEELIKKSNKPIVFTGFVHQTLLYKYYQIADIAVMPSMFQDPAPLVCIETQATGTPLIANNVGGISEYSNPDGVILVDKDEKLTTNIANQIDKLLNDDELVKAMGESNREFAKQFNTETYFKDFSAIMQKILEEQKN